MKNTLLLFLFFSFFLHRAAVAQQKEKNVSDSVFTKYAFNPASGFDPVKPYYIVVSNETLPVKSVRAINRNTGIIEIKSKAALDSLNKNLQLAVANDTWKFSPALEHQLKNASGKEQKFIVAGQKIDALLTALQKNFPLLPILSVNRPSNSVVIKCSFAYLHEQLLPLKQVIYADIVADAHPEAKIIGYDRSFHGINAVDFLLPGANGKNIVAGVKEQTMDENDLDLWKRVLPSPLAAPTTSSHATVIASIIGGAGNSSYEGRGIARECLFFPSSFANLFADDEAVLKANKVSVQNHSYGTIIQQFYGAEAVSYDLLCWNNKTLIPVMSAGNQGNAFATEGPYANIPGYANLTGNFKMAKNVITVAAIDNKENIPVLSSAGPVYDGRLAPQLTALGPSGTSDAAAVVSGTIAVMQQVYADSNGTIPSASLVKAVLYNTAEDIDRPGIDYKTGYGLLDSYAAVKALQQKQFEEGYLSNGKEWAKTIVVPANTAELKITLAWTDSAASVNNNKALIHDLDLTVTEEATGHVYQPWVLSTASNIDSLAALPTRRRDSLNTAEQVSIHLPAPGNYRVNVKGTAIGTPSLPFHIAYKTDTLHAFRFTNPLHASDIYAGADDNLTIRWKTFVADSSEAGNLFISYNDGSKWELLASNISLQTKKYRWNIKDTTAIAVLKMETGFGSFISNRFLLCKPTRLQVDFNCADSLRLSWNKNSLASAYRVYTLTDSPYLKPVTVVSDSFVVLQRAQYPTHIFAVEPLLANGIPAAQSSALNADLQGVHCFYQTLNYNLLDNNQLNLLLALSTAAYVDSVYFENVTAAGQLLQTYGGAKVKAPDLVYTQFVNSVPSGITYLRGKIKLTNGAIVYTDIVPLLTSGKKMIWFYPVPVKRSGELKYMLQQGVPASSRLQFFDGNGRLLRNYASMPDKISLAEFAAGLLFYRLLTEDGNTLETGKILVTQ